MKEILSGVSVDHLLVVTFTKAAAAEMKKRIKEVLSNEMQKSSKKSYLRQQLNLIDSANISTIDAFCLDVIHRFYYVIDIDPSFSILTDDSQAELMRERALKEVEGEFLEKKDRDFIAFYDNFAGDRDAASPQNLLLDLYNYAKQKTLLTCLKSVLAAICMIWKMIVHMMSNEKDCVPVFSKAVCADQKIGTKILLLFMMSAVILKKKQRNRF